jgi:hypothetical protein
MTDQGVFNMESRVHLPIVRIVLFLLTSVLTSTTVKADCLACWELRKVEIILKNGESKTGFVHWNESWLNEKVKNWKELRNKFPENLLECYRNSPDNREILVLTKLTTVKNDSLIEFKATTEKDQFRISVDEIVKMVELEKNLEKYQGAGSIPIYTQAELDSLKTNPYATYQMDISVSDVYFLSYNKDIKRQQLREISESDYWPEKEELAKKGVIIITLGYD